MARVIWQPQALISATERAFKTAAKQVKVTIEATKPAKSIPVRGPYYGMQMRGAARGVRVGKGEVAVIKSGGLAPIFEQGAKPHDIFPGAVRATRRSYSRSRGASSSVRSRRGGKRALKIGDQFAAHVSHPGMRAQPFLGPGAAKFAGFYNAALRLYLPRVKL